MQARTGDHHQPFGPVARPSWRPSQR